MSVFSTASIALKLSLIPFFCIAPSLQAGDYLVGMIERSLPVLAKAKNTTDDPSHAAAQGYWLAVASKVLRTPGDTYSDDFKAEVIELGRGELDDLIGGQSAVIGGGPAFGLTRPFDAFGDKTENPPGTAYTFNSGVAAWGALSFLRAVAEIREKRPEWWESAVVAAGKWVLYWEPYYTEMEEGGEKLGYWWYSDNSADAGIAVHNTSLMIAIAADDLRTLVPTSAATKKAGEMADANFRFFRRRLFVQDGAAVWNYADDGSDPKRVRIEDVGHSVLDFEFIQHWAENEAWSEGELVRFRKTLTDKIWTDTHDAPPANIAGIGIFQQEAHSATLQSGVGSSLSQRS